MPGRPAQQPLLEVGGRLGDEPSHGLTAGLPGTRRPRRKAGPGGPGRCGWKGCFTAGRWHRWHEWLRGKGLVLVAGIASFPFPPADLEDRAPAETKTKKAGAKGQGTSCLLTPAYAATDPPAAVPDCPSSRLPSCSFVACTASATAATPPPPSWAVVNRKRSLTQRGKYIAQSGSRKKTAGSALYLRAAPAGAVACCRFQTVGGSRLLSIRRRRRSWRTSRPLPSR